MFKYVPLAVLAATLPLRAQEAPRDAYVEDFEKREILDIAYEGWEAVRSPAHPAYNEIRLEDDPAGARSGRRYVRLNTLGGHTAFRMLPRSAWEIDPGRSYRLSAWVRLNGARANAASLTLTWLDAQLRPVAEDRSTPVIRTEGWTPAALDVPRVPPAARRATVTLRFEGRDVRGSCDFDRLELAGRPRLEIVPAGRRLPVFEPGEAPRLLVTAPGLRAGEHRLEAATRTPEGKEIHRLGPVAILPAKPVALDFPPHAPGYYEVHLALSSDGTTAARRVTPLAVPNPSAAAGSGLFGATFNPFTTDYAGATELMRLGGFTRARVTLWDRPSSGRRGAPDAAAILALLRDIGDAEPLLLAGLLAEPPEGTAEDDRETLEHGPLALLGAHPDLWGPAFRDTVRRYREHVTHWQIGGEGHAEAASRPGAGAALRTARETLVGLSPSARLGVPVRSPEDAPKGADFVTAVLPAAAGGREVYGALATPPGDAASLLRRLVERAAAGPRPAAVFLPVDASPIGGMLDADGYPLAPLLAVRAANEVLSGAVYRKDLRLFDDPIRDFVFEKDGRIAAAVWCEGGEVERDLHLGPEAEIFPPLGAARRQKPGEPLRVGPMPVFLRNVDAALVRTQLSLDFFDPAGTRDARLPLQLDPVRKTLKLRNCFLRGAMEDARVKFEGLPAGWAVRPLSEGAASPGAGEELALDFSFALPRDAAEGPREVGIELSFRRDGKPCSIRLKRVIEVVPAISIGAEVSAVPAGRRLTIRVGNRAGRPALLAARIRLPGLPERMETLGIVAPEADRALEVVLPGAALPMKAEVICEERGASRLHARRVIEFE